MSKQSQFQRRHVLAAVRTGDNAAIDGFGEFFRQILENVQTAIGVGSICNEVNGPNETGLFPPILRSWSAVEINQHGKVHLLGPLDSLDEVGVLRELDAVRNADRMNAYLARHIWFVVEQVHSPVPERNAHRVCER